MAEFKRGEWEPPEEYHILNFAGAITYIDDEVRREIEVWLENLTPDNYFNTLTVTTLLNEELTLVVDSINAIYSSTPEARYRSNEFTRMLNDERLSQGFPEDD